MPHFVHAAGQSRGTGIQLRGGVGDGLYDTLITGLHGIEGPRHLPHLVGARQRHAGGQVAGFFDVQHHVFERVELAEQELNQQLRSAEHRQHQHEHRYRVVRQTFDKHLRQAWRVGQYRNPLAVRAGDDLGAQQRVVPEERHGVEGDPPIALTELRQGVFVHGGNLARTHRQQEVDGGQGLTARPGTEQLRLRMGIRAGSIAARLLFELHGVEHQQQRGDEGHRVDGPEFVFERDVAKPGTHGRFSLIWRKQYRQGAIIVPSVREGLVDVGQGCAGINASSSSGSPKKARAQAVV